MIKLTRDLVVIIVLFVLLAVGTFVNTLGVQTIQKSLEQSQQNELFLRNFSSYMHCLIVVDEVLYVELGKDAYFARCDALLFKGTNVKAPIREPRVTTTSTTVPSVTATTVDPIIGGPI